LIANVSRLSQFQGCREKAHNWDELRLTSYRDADPLMIGEAYHNGSEVLSKLGDVEAAVKSAEDTFRNRLKGQMILPEELPEIEREIEFVKHATRAWASHYNTAEFRVLWPEVSGLVPLPNTEHHCFFSHRLLYPNVPYDICLEQNHGKCRHPHFLKFRTDGVLEFAHKIWLLEQKTTTSTARNNFWPKWNMEFQVGCYLYGVWKLTGQRPSGVMINAIIKKFKQDRSRPTGNGGYKMSLIPTEVDFEREAFIYSEEMLLSFEHDLICLANEYEDAFRLPQFKIFRNTGNCFSYNRACYYWERCQRKFSGQPPDIDGEFRQRTKDYVELEYYKMLGLPLPAETTEEPVHGTR
jgi:hypothetical protein